MLNIYQNKKGKIGFRKMRSMIILFILTTFFSFRINAATFTVTNLNDAGAGSLRQAILDANSNAGADVINFSITGTISLTSGQISVTDALTITGPGMNLLTINQTTDNRVFITATGAITFVLQDLTLNFTGPGAVPYSGGGGAILTGGAGASTTLTNVTISNFRNQIGNGGAISASSSLNNHNLTITNCIFTNNKCGGAGGAVSYNSLGGTATITSCTFSGNQTGQVGVNAGGDGGAIATTGGGAGGTYLIEKNTFLNNQVQNVTGHAGAVINTNGTLTLQYNRFIGNTCLNVANPPLANVIGQAGGATTHVTIANNNWWGVNTGPITNDATALNTGAVMTLTKWLQLKTTASPNPICFLAAGPGNTSTVTTSFLSNSANEAITASNLFALVGASVTWGPTTLGSLSGQQGTIQASGTATALFTSNGTGGTATVNARMDNVPASENAPSRASIIVNATPAPTVSNPVTYCLNATASALTASGSTLLWYSTATGGTGSETAPTPMTTSAGTTSYFVSQTVNGCEGPRAQIDVVVNEIPSITTPTITQPSCVTPTGTIVVNATGTGTLEYSVDNGNTYQEAATFSGLAPGDYYITVRPKSSPLCVIAFANNPVTLNAVPSCLELSINDVEQNEGNSGTTTFTFTVSLSAPAPAGGVSFDIATQNGTTNPATQPSDYTSKSLTSQTIPAGSSTYTFTVAVNGDTEVEPNETFFVNVSNVTGASISDGQGLGTITNDDLASCSISSASFSNVSSCNNNGTPANSADDFYTVDLTVNFSTPPATGTLRIEPGNVNVLDVVEIAVGSLTGTSHTFTGVRLRTTGAAFSVEVEFSANNACVRTIAAPAVISCSAVICSISSASFSNVSSCNNNGTAADPADDFYTADLTVNFTNPPAAGTLRIEPGNVNVLDVVEIAVGSITGSSHTFTGVRLRTTGAAFSVEVEFSANNACVRTIAAPAVGSCAVICVLPAISAPTVTQPNCAVPTGTIVVNATGNGTLEYSINGGTSWSPIATFSKLPPGNYNISVRLQSNPACVDNYSSNPVILTEATGCVVVCPKSQGYWKNNTSAWPASALPMMLGTSRTYTKQQLLTILRTSPGSGTKSDASLILVHQLIAAKLNIATGATAPASVNSAITAADAAIGNSLIPMNIRTNTTLGKTMTSLAQTLESFNAGQLNTGCGTLLTTSTIPNGLSMKVVPENFELEQNYPNPFNTITTIRYVVPVESTVSIAVYNNQGQLMAKLADGRVNAGNHQVQFDASKLAAGIYLYRLQTVDVNGQIVIINKKMMLSK